MRVIIISRPFYFAQDRLAFLLVLLLLDRGHSRRFRPLLELLTLPFSLKILIFLQLAQVELLGNRAL